MTGERYLDRRPQLEDLGLAVRVSLVLWIMGLFLFVALAIPALADAVQAVDDRVWQLVVDIENDLVVAFATALDFLGSTWVTAPIIVVVAAVLAWKRLWEDLATWTLAMVVSQLFIGPVKVLYERERPPLPLVETSSWSFPSGHAVAGAAIAIALVIVLIPAGPRRRRWEVLAALFAVAMGLSRVYLRAHWLSDVVAGVALGAAISIAAAALIHWVDQRRALQVSKPVG